MSEEDKKSSEEIEKSELQTDAADVDETKVAPADRADNGPYDASEVPSMRPYIDMGGIKIAPREGLKVRLDVDEKTKRIVAISLDYQGSTLQVQGFSAPKSTGLWNILRAQLVQNLTSQKAQVTEREGPLGPELFVIPPQGKQAQAVRFVGVDGPRWTLRGVIIGAAAQGGAEGEGVESVFREIVVVRGDAPMPPSELLQLKVPAGLQQAAQQQSEAQQTSQDS